MIDKTEAYLKETLLLNFFNKNIQKLIKERGWLELEEVQKVKSIYSFVKDEILFGYNRRDEIPASEILNDGYGQCNTKATLLMTLLRGVGIANRIHGFTIDKKLQKGAITGVAYRLSPPNILHSWVEVLINEEWYFLEGVILDEKYLSNLQDLNKECTTTFCGYGVFTNEFQNPNVEWNLDHTMIQSLGINQDFGLFNSPDEFYAKHHQDLSWIKKKMFKLFIRSQMNKNVIQIREINNDKNVS